MRKATGSVERLTRVLVTATALSVGGTLTLDVEAQAQDTDFQTTENTADVDYTTIDTYDGGMITLDTVVVQGEKIPRDIFDTYTSVDVVGSGEIEDYNYNTVDQALNTVGNVRSFESGTGNSSFVIRGLNAEGVTQPSRSSPVISVLVDGAEQGIEATRRGSRGLWDVEQVEVLRGPQSTTQGRNSLAGSVIIKTKDPTYEPEVILEGMAGNQDYLSGAFAVNAPIIDNQFAVRIAGQKSRETKDIDYANPALAELEEDEYEQIRGKFLFTPEAMPGLRALFTVSRTHDKPGWGLVSGPDFFDRHFDDSTTDSAEFRDTHVNRYIADVSYEITPDWTVRSVTSFVDTGVTIESPSASSFIRDDTREGADFAQDLQLTYESPDDPFSGVFGVFAGRFTTDLDSSIQTTLLAPYGVPLIDVQMLTAENKTESIAAYADTRYRFFEDWTLIAGGRILRDEVSADYAGTALDFATTIGTGIPTFGSLDENNSTANTVFLPKIGLAYDLTDNQTVAFTASRGYRAGFSEAVAGSTAINEVEPEYLWSYDIAYRSRWFDDTLKLNANAFYYDYENQQVLTFNPNFSGQTITANSGKSHAYGAEAEVRWMPMPEIELFSSLGLLKTEFDEGVTASGINLEGKEFPEAPAVTFAAGGIWRHHSGIFAEADMSFTDGFYSSGDLANTSSRLVDSFTLVNAQIGYEYNDFSVAAFAKNIFDEQYLTSINETGSQATIGDGRTYGLKATGKF
ncbi:TonB-dependent receptor [Jiella marina]|uniref:TonB-dependent receptor n=1 Tax=Jiella sp. LLJ827 TaxID=2917712 RepID=UPI002100853B|nr:TonB-dependent receptor [Jiella sp. LLJ827]MCQ0988028.1 TonB-dependent receptor [Jiella sp. LLJ827]